MSEQRCPSCGYTEDDAKLHMDHRLCSNAGNAPWERRADRNLVRDYDADGVERKPRYTVSELEAQLRTANEDRDAALAKWQTCRGLREVEQVEASRTGDELRATVAQQAATIGELEKNLANEKNEWRIACKLMDEKQRDLRQANETNRQLTSDFNVLVQENRQQAATIGELRDALQGGIEYAREHGSENGWPPAVSEDVRNWTELLSKIPKLVAKAKEPAPTIPDTQSRGIPFRRS